MELTANKYKVTEVGLLPEDWKVSSLEELFKIIGGGTFKSKDRVTNGVKWLKIANVGVKKVKWDEIDYLPTQFLQLYSDFVLNEGDIIMALTRPILGRELKIARVMKQDEPCLLNQRVGKIEPITNFDLDWIYHLLQSYKSIIGLLDSMAGSDPPNLSNKGIYSVRLPIPPNISEQKAIAKVLTDTDALIHALEKKIAKKKLIKKGVMQKLLTPKEGWVESKVASIGQPYGGMSGKTKADFSNGNAQYVPFMNVMSNPITDIGYLDSVKINKGESQNKIIKGDLLFNGSSETPEEVGFCSAVLDQIDNLYLNSFCFGFRIFNTKQYDSLFLAYFFRSTLGRKFFYSLAQGATRYNLSKTNFLKSTLTLPTYDDQVQIANVIRDIDSEIQNLEQKLAKYQLAKQGMMQQLLTGKIRLV